MDIDAVALEQGGTEFIIPVRGNRQVVALDAEGSGLVLEALAMARFSGAWEQLHRNHLRWRLQKTFAYHPMANRVEVTLHLEAEERVLAAPDLRLGTPWSEPPKERFSDLAGHAEAISIGKKAVAWLADPNSEGGLRAFVVEGPAGVGKSMYCLAAAGEANVACIRIAASEWMGVWWGETEKAIRSTFQALSQYEACVLVVEEFECAAYARDRASASSPAYFASIVGTLLTSLDKLRQGPARVLFLATTNHYDQLDPSVVRSLRMERLHLDLPGNLDRRQLLAKLGLVGLSPEDLDEAARSTSGLTQADLVSLGARFVAAGTGHRFPAFQDLVAARHRGPVDVTHALSLGAKARVAVHEAGHALAAYFLLGPDSVEHLSLVPGIDGSEGAFCLRPAAQQTLFGAEKQKRHIAVCLAGRAAEGLLFPEDGGSQGAATDLSRATQLAVAAVGELGMDAGFSGLAFSSLPASVCEYLAPRLAAGIQAWLSEAATTAQGLLACHQGLLQNLADTLVQEETLQRARILALIEEK
jgi:ATP-dependent Zn protease